MHAIDKETEQLVKRTQAVVREAKLRRLSLAERRRRHYQLYLRNVRAGGRDER
jgi:hypothetical protein